MFFHGEPKRDWFSKDKPLGQSMDAEISSNYIEVLFAMWKLQVFSYAITAPTSADRLDCTGDYQDYRYVGKKQIHLASLSRQSTLSRSQQNNPVNFKSQLGVTTGVCVYIYICVCVLLQILLQQSRITPSPLHCRLLWQVPCLRKPGQRRLKHPRADLRCRPVAEMKLILERRGHKQPKPGLLFLMRQNGRHFNR